MKRIWNALIYGDAETKRSIGSVIFFSVLAAILIVISCISGEFNIFILGMIAVIIAIILSQSFTLVDDDFVAEVNRKGDKDTVRSVTAKKNKIVDSEESITDSKDRLIDASGDIQKDNLEGVSEKGQREPVKRETIDVNCFVKYNQKVMKKIKRKYHMKKDHRPIIIDSSDSYRIKQCPAFIWRAHNKVFILLLEKEPRRICISRELIHNMGYRPNVIARKEQEYIAFQKESLVSKVFGEYLPDYFDSKVKNDPLKVKNLYTIYPDICLTNRSAFQVMDLLLLNFMPEDRITKADKINGFFKRIYASNILLKDKVYSITEYKEAVEKTLGEMCYAEMPRREYIITLENLVKARLISQQYADHYISLRDKIREKNQ